MDKVGLTEENAFALDSASKSARFYNHSNDSRNRCCLLASTCTHPFLYVLLWRYPVANVLLEACFRYSYRTWMVTTAKILKHKHRLIHPIILAILWHHVPFLIFTVCCACSKPDTHKIEGVLLFLQIRIRYPPLIMFSIHCLSISNHALQYPTCLVYIMHMASFCLVIT